MTHLSKVRKHQTEYDSLFEPLAEILHVLKTYNVQIPKDVQILMEVWIAIIFFKYIFHYYFIIIFNDILINI